MQNAFLNLIKITVQNATLLFILGNYFLSDQFQLG